MILILILILLLVLLEKNAGQMQISKAKFEALNTLFLIIILHIIYILDCYMYCLLQG